MAQFGTVITNIGLAKIANAQITQETVGIKHMVLGDGNGAYYTLSQSQTSLKREVWRGLIADEQRDPSNPNRIAFSAYIPSTAGGFTIREVGLLDTAGNLIAVSLYPEQYKPQLAEGVSDDLLLHFVLETSNASVVTLAVDPTIVIASRKYVDDKVAGAIGDIGTNLTELQGQVTTHLAETAKKTTDNLTFYVDGVNGSDDNTGLAAGTAFRSIMKAISKIPQIVNHAVTINVLPGTYNEDVQLSGYMGYGGIAILGANSLQSVGNYRINRAVITHNNCQINMTGFEATTNAHTAFLSYLNGHCYFAMCKTSAVTTTQRGFDVQLSFCIITNSHASNRYVGIIADYTSTLFSQTNEGANNVYGILARAASTIGKSSTQPSGTTAAELVETGGVIR